MSFGEGDFLKTVNLAFAAADYTDADCNAATAGAVVLGHCYSPFLRFAGGKGVISTVTVSLGSLDGVANDCADALRMSLITEPGLVPPATLEMLAPLVDKYLDRTGGRPAWKR